jgi:hypothetical protein
MIIIENFEMECVSEIFFFFIPFEDYFTTSNMIKMIITIMISDHNGN